MELVVQRQKAIAVAPDVEFLQLHVFIHAVDDLAVAYLAGFRHQLRFEHVAEVTDIVAVSIVQIRHEGAVLRVDVDDVAPLQFQDRLADGRPAHVERFGERLLLQLFARQEPHMDDIVLQHTPHILAGALFAPSLQYLQHVLYPLCIHQRIYVRHLLSF